MAGAYEAIRDFSLDIAEGEFVAIVGATGSGKSTLLRLLVGLDAGFDGEILVDGAPVRGIGAERGIVFQEHRLFPWLSVTRNVALGLAAQHVPEENAAVAGGGSGLAWSVCKASRMRCRINCQAAWRSVWRLREVWWQVPASSRSMNRSARSTP